MALLGLPPVSDGAEEPPFERARRAYYAGRYQDALALLEGLGDQDAAPAWRHLLIGGCQRGLGRSARASFEAAAAASEHARFTELLGMMAALSDAPWPAERGPLAGPEPGD